MAIPFDKDLVTGRGPVAGTGEALSDEEALEILDERVKSPQASAAPDIGVVIDPGQEGETVEKHPHQEQLLDMFNKTQHWASQMPRCVVTVPNPQTPLTSILKRSFDPLSGAMGQIPTLASALRLRVMVGDSMFDLLLSPADAAKPGYTLEDLLDEAGPLTWAQSYEP
jgi:hypothetical protein